MGIFVPPPADGVGYDSSEFAIWTIRAEEIAAAAALVSAGARGVGDAAAAKAIDAANRSTIDPLQQRTITLELFRPGGSFTPPDSGSSNLPIVGGVRTPLTVATLTFDIYTGPIVNGYPQRIETTFSARQTEHQTAVGFYVDEFNEEIGSLTVDVLVIWNGAPQQQIQQFFDLLHKAKLTTPLSNEAPMKLRFHDSYLQRSYYITQRDVHLDQTVEMLGFARLSMSAGILQDYSSPQNTAPSQTVLNDNTPNIAASAIAALQTFDGPGGVEQSSPTGIQS